MGLCNYLNKNKVDVSVQQIHACACTQTHTLQRFQSVELTHSRATIISKKTKVHTSELVTSGVYQM